MVRSLLAIVSPTATACASQTTTQAEGYRLTR